MATTPINTFSVSELVPMYPGFPSPEVPVKLAASSTFYKGQLLGEKVGNNEAQTVTITGTPTGGTFTLTYAGQTTAAIAYNATALAVQTALEALSNIADEDVLVTGGPGPGTPYVVTFQNQLGYLNVAQMTATGSFTGGSSPAIAVTTTTAGSAGTRGEYGGYDPDNTDGTQLPKLILKRACTTDASGNITEGSGLFGETRIYTSAFAGGSFACSDLVNLDENAVSLLNGRLLNGDISDGIFVF